jgi:hypothetical protein
MKVVVHNLSSDLPKKNVIIKIKWQARKISRMVRLKIRKVSFVISFVDEVIKENSFLKKSLEKKSNL